jgi:hypothetical protein
MHSMVEGPSGSELRLHAFETRMPDLYDEYGELTDFGEVMRIACVLLAIISGIAFIPVSFFALLGVPMACDGGGACAHPGPYRDAVSAAAASPMLLIISMFAGAFGAKYPTWKLIVMSFTGPLFTAASVVVISLAR